MHYYLSSYVKYFLNRQIYYSKRHSIRVLSPQPINQAAAILNALTLPLTPPAQSEEREWLIAHPKSSGGDLKLGDTWQGACCEMVAAG